MEKLLDYLFLCAYYLFRFAINYSLYILGWFIGGNIWGGLALLIIFTLIRKLYP